MTKSFPSSLFLLSILGFLLSHTTGLVSPNRVSRQASSRTSISTTSSTSLHARLSFVQASSSTTLVPEAPTVVVPLPIQIDPARRQKQEKSDKTEDLWEVRVYNDEVNTHEWVARCLVVVAGATEWQAYLTTKQAHQEGDAHLGLYEKEIAEVYTQGLREQGIVVQMFPIGDFQ